jgi:hypothetical protein
MIGSEPGLREDTAMLGAEPASASTTNLLLEAVGADIA